MNTEIKTEYGADQIQILEGLEARDRVCILAVLHPEVCITLCMRLWIMR